jgi:hypothetical protein
MKLLKLLIGPEILWGVIFISSKWIAKANVKPNFRYDDLIANAYVILPILTFLSFGFSFIPPSEKSWLIVRIWILSLVVGHFSLSSLASAYSNQGPGIGMSYLAGMCFILVTLIAGTLLLFLFAKH